MSYIVLVTWHMLLEYCDFFAPTAFPLIEAGSHIQAGGLTAFVPIAATSQIHAWSLIEAGV